MCGRVRLMLHIIQSLMICKGSKMPCESCAVQFSVFRRKRMCSECERYYCSGCLRRGGGTMCAPCRALSTRPLCRQTIAHLKVRDLQCFLQRQNVSTRGCVEKEELVNLCVLHVNSSSYRRRGSRGATSPFTTLKGLTNNINEFINSALDLGNNARPTRAASRSCYNSAHAHIPPESASAQAPAPRERFTTTPGGERDIVVEVPRDGGSPGGEEAARVDTTDCFEIEDLDDSGWEFVNRPAEPLPNDSEVLLSTTINYTSMRREEREEDVNSASGRRERASESTSDRRSLHELDSHGGREREREGLEVGESGGTPQRAASELNLHRSESGTSNADTVSLQDEPLILHDNDNRGEISLESLRTLEELEALSVKQLKELLARNRVEFRGCLERAELLDRAKMLWREHAQYKDDIDKMPMEECCKICMAAPLECVLLECGHIAACTRCSKQLAECPICRQYVVRAVRFFRS